MEIEELVFNYGGFVVRLKKDFVRLDISIGMEADGYHLDFSSKEDIIKICELMDKPCSRCDGSGEIPTSIIGEMGICPGCNGKGYLKKINSETSHKVGVYGKIPKMKK